MAAKKRRKHKAKKNPKRHAKRRTHKRVGNPRRHLRRRARRNPARRTHARKHARRANPSRRRVYRRRRNPGTEGFTVAAVAVASGLAAAIVSSYVIDVFFPNQSPVVQTGILVVASAGVAYYVASPAIVAGAAVGLLLVPVSKSVYKFAPALANPQPMASSAPPPVPMSALHLRALHAGKRNAGIRKLTRHKRLNGLNLSHRIPGAGMGALHLRGVTINRGAGKNPVLARSFGR
jgi:hypothetical protein